MKKYILNISGLQAGDIILTGGKEIASLSVRAFTASRYSHAALFVGDTTIEATLEGVFSTNPQRTLNAFFSTDQMMLQFTVASGLSPPRKNKQFARMHALKQEAYML